MTKLKKKKICYYPKGRKKNQKIWLYFQISLNDNDLLVFDIIVGRVGSYVVRLQLVNHFFVGQHTGVLLLGGFYSPDEQFLQPSFVAVALRRVLATGILVSGRAEGQTPARNGQRDVIKNGTTGR